MSIVERPTRTQPNKNFGVLRLDNNNLVTTGLTRREARRRARAGNRRVDNRLYQPVRIATYHA